MRWFSVFFEVIGNNYKRFKHFRNKSMSFVSLTSATLGPKETLGRSQGEYDKAFHMAVAHNDVVMTGFPSWVSTRPATEPYTMTKTVTAGKRKKQPSLEQIQAIDVDALKFRQFGCTSIATTFMVGTGYLFYWGSLKNKALWWGTPFTGLISYMSWVKREKVKEELRYHQHLRDLRSKQTQNKE